MKVPDEYTMLAVVIEKNETILYFEDYEFEVIGHPITIGRCLQW
jgi:hypothetical protein